jgi:hypothetical protein
MNRSTTIIPIALAGLAATALAGPEWPESAVDAGSLPVDAQTPKGSGPLAKISGNLAASSGFASGDFQDMYLIRIVDPGAFSATIDTATAFNTQLWLFNAFGLGLLANDDESSATRLSAIPVTGANDGTGAVVPKCGLYYIAISGAASDPVSAVGPIFDQVTPTEVSGPDGFGGSSPITAWTAAGDSGTYAILLSGTEFVACDADFDDDDKVSFADLTILLAAWGPCPPGGPCETDLDDNGSTGFADLTELLATWGRCCPPLPV